MLEFKTYQMNETATESKKEEEEEKEEPMELQEQGTRDHVTKTLVE